jgi:hypothetical protein
VCVCRWEGKLEVSGLQQSEGEEEEGRQMHVFYSTGRSKLGNVIQGLRRNAATLDHNRLYESSKKRKVKIRFV